MPNSPLAHFDHPASERPPKTAPFCRTLSRRDAHAVADFPENETGHPPSVLSNPQQSGLFTLKPHLLTHDLLVVLELSIVKTFTIILYIVATAALAFGYWGKSTDAGRARFDEMAGIIPYFTFYAGIALAALALILTAVLVFRSTS